MLYGVFKQQEGRQASMLPGQFRARPSADLPSSFLPYEANHGHLVLDFCYLSNGRPLEGSAPSMRCELITASTYSPKVQRMAAAGTATAELSMKLFVDTKTQRVVVAVASTEVLDLLRSLLASPPHDEPLDFDAMTVDGCISNLYDTLDVLDAAAARSRGPRHHCPCCCDCDDCSPPDDAQSQHEAAQAAEQKKCFYGCSSRRGAGCRGYVTEARGASCPSCGGEMAMEVPLGSPGAGCSTGGAYAGGGGAAGGTWALMDNLKVMPLPDFQFQPTVAAYQNLLPAVFGCFNQGASLREETVCVGFTQVMQILKTSLRSSTVLTEVFIIRGKVPAPA